VLVDLQALEVGVARPDEGVEFAVLQLRGALAGFGVGAADVTRAAAGLAVALSGAFAGAVPQPTVRTAAGPLPQPEPFGCATTRGAASSTAITAATVVIDRRDIRTP
ncbi:MAG: hypothetical protein WCQ64_16080, partial [Acidobacteriota bacterium]